MPAWSSRRRPAIPGPGRACEALGPTYIKLGQILSARPDLVPPGFARALSRLHTRVVPLGPPIVRRMLAQSYGAPVETMFTAFEDAPIGSGSIAQVHRARLTDGREIALKVRRLGGERLIDADLKLLMTLARMARLWPALRFVPAEHLVADVGDMIRRQVDLAKEADNLRRFAR